jgi:hypothetical protein
MSNRSKRMINAASRWAKLSKSMRESVIANLEFDANSAEDAAPFGGPISAVDAFEARERRHAFLVAAQVLRDASTTYATYAAEMEALQRRMVELDRLMDPHSTKAAP